jgi:hypothetical protein
MEANIINLFGFTFRDNVFEWGENYIKTIQTTFLKSWNKHFASDSGL